METKQESVSARRRRERSVMLVPAIVTTALVVTLVPAAVVFVSRMRRRAAEPGKRQPGGEAGNAEEARPTWREACADALRDLPGMA